MTKHVSPEDAAAVDSALSFFVGKTLATLVEESGVQLAAVKRVIRDGIERGALERDGNRYRIENSAPWLARAPKPPHVEHPPVPPSRGAARTVTLAAPSPPPPKAKVSAKLRADVAALLGESTTGECPTCGLPNGEHTPECMG